MKPIFYTYPVLKLDHLRLLTDDTGILQHAMYNIPRRNDGYCTDDNARALIASILARRFCPDPTLYVLAGRYLSFLEHAFINNSGRFKNFMTFDRRWIEEEGGSEDSHGRAVWALGFASSLPPSSGLSEMAGDLFRRAVPALLNFTSPRSWAFGINGLCAFLDRFQYHTQIKKALAVLAGKLFRAFEENASDDWPWIDDRLTYSNGKIPQALMTAGRILQRPELTAAGLTSLRWLIELQKDQSGHFVPIGNKGWCLRYGERARFDQQPVEAQAMTDACITAFEMIGDPCWIDHARCSFEWFLGRNDLGLPLYNDVTGGCRDGLQPRGVNQNPGGGIDLILV